MNIVIHFLGQLYMTYGKYSSKQRTIRGAENRCKEVSFQREFTELCQENLKYYHENWITIWMEFIDFEKLPLCGPFKCNEIFSIWNMLTLTLVLGCIAKIIQFKLF